MRLKQKQFVPFMIAVAVITAFIIVYSSFNFNNKRSERFKENIASADSLPHMSLSIIGTEESTDVASKKGKVKILVFWASWSEKSVLMLNEIEAFATETDSVSVLAALVKDAEESLPADKKYPDFVYVDGTHLFNYLKTPGFPSYILFDENGEVIYAHVGYQKGAGYEILKSHIP